MTDISPTERQVFPLTAGRNVFLAGMDWKTLPASHKNPRTFARSLGAVRYISCEYLSTEDTDRHIMVAAVSQNTIPKGSRRYFSLAMLILPLLEPGGYAIVELSQANDTELYGFVSAVDGILVSDLVGTREEIREAREIFLTINSAPEHGWTCYEPPSFNGPDGRGPLPLETLTGAGKYPAEAR
ncbi:type 4b pilus protein PilO2, partial [Escherichia coli]|nr:type 4b pilus protein PilO2 [Escherichia coli]